MGNPAGVRRDFQALEQRRLRAARLLQQGVHQSEVARRVGAHRQSVSRWAAAIEAGRTAGAEESGARWTQTALASRRSAADRARIETRAASAGVRNQSVDVVAGGPSDRAGMRGPAITPRMPGGSCGNWDGVASVRRAGRWSGTKRRSGDGSRSAGRRLKKSPKRRPHHRLHRRKRIERAPAPLPYLGAAGTDAGAAISLQLEDAVGDGGGDVVELLLPACFPAPSAARRSSSSSRICCAIFPASC